MTAQPLASCLMPTANRRQFIPGAIKQFLAQDYENAELVILDDGADSIADLVPEHPKLRYLRRPPFKTLGAKRNAAVEAAEGEILLHWDDDDWYAPRRIRLQVEALLASNADLCGIDRALFVNPQARAAWEYVYPQGSGAPWVCGATLCYRRTFWQRHKFPETNVGEDTSFAAAVRREKLHILQDNRFFAALIHPANTSPKHVSDRRWQTFDFAAVRALTGPDWPHAEPAAQAIPPVGVSVIIPFSGRQRLGVLAACIAGLRQSAIAVQIIIAEMGPEPLAQEIACRWQAEHVFIAAAGPFDKARAINAGSLRARYDGLVWCDGDLLFGEEFLSRALAEFRAGGFDFLFPFSRIDYLDEAQSREVRQGVRSPADCRPVRALRPMRGGAIGGMGLVKAGFLRRYGGMIEGFFGWGGEDNAWVHKASLLGRVGVTSLKDQIVWHLFHPDSAGAGGQPWRSNPFYQRNVELLARVQRIRTAAEFLREFPPGQSTDAIIAPPPAVRDVPVWTYWEGPMPGWIALCLETIRRHAPGLRVLGPAEFDALWDQDRDINLSHLHVAQRADFIRAFLLMRYGGMWIDADCIMLRSLAPLLARLNRFEVIAHRERQGFFSNAFLAFRRESALAARFYATLCARLRAKRPLGWIGLGNEPLTEILQTALDNCFELPVEQVQPVCWSQPERYFVQGADAAHERSFDRDAWCYMLSQQNILRHQRTTGAALEAEDSFFSFLLRRAGETETPAAQVPPAAAPPELLETFTRMSAEHHEQGHESVSGPGSSLQQTVEIRRRLPFLLQHLNAESLLDAPCGDFNWMAAVKTGVADYTGIDLLETLIQRNRERHAAPGRQFLALNIVEDKLPQADVIFCRDFLGHMCTADIFRILRNFIASGSRYLLTTTFPGRPAAPDIANGEWRALNLQAAPFSLPPPLYVINEKCSECCGAFADKSLGLWRLNDVKLFV